MNLLFRLRKCRFIFILLRYNRPLFADTNSVICKIIVGAGAHDSPLCDDENVFAGRRGAAPYKCEKEKDIL